MRPDEAEKEATRIAWADGTRVGAWFAAKGPAKSAVQIQHRGLADRATATRTKAFWLERLDELGRLLAK